MAKKGQSAQLQADLVNEDEWEKFLQRDGLLVIDIYSAWCGPCIAMQANLKKLKLEVGGDFLQLGMARCDHIEALKRFRNKSEPTWMFVAQGQQVNILFGSNAPALQKLILDEMKKERECLGGTRSRVERLPEQYSEQEQKIHEVQERSQQLKEKQAIEKAFKELKERRIAQAKNILDSLSHVGLVLFFPHAVKKGLEIFESFLPESGISVNKKERPMLTEAQIEEIEFLSPYKMPEASKESLYAERALALMLSVDQEIAPGPIDNTILEFVYGPSKKPPGDEGSIAFKLLKSQINKKQPPPEAEAEAAPNAIPSPEATLSAEGGLEEVASNKMEDAEKADPSAGDKDQDLGIGMEGAEEEEPEEEEEEEEEDIIGIWAPANDLVKSTALKYFFPLITAPLILPEPKAVPPHLVLAFESFKLHDVIKLINEYPEEVMSYGFFTSDDCDTAKLIAKTKNSYESSGIKHGEKLVLSVAKKTSDVVLAFAQLGPSYMSSNVQTGEYESSVFFPEGYADTTQEKKEVAKQQPKAGSKEEPVAEEITFEGVFEGEMPEEFEDLGGDVEVIPPMDMTELPDVEEEETWGEDKGTSTGDNLDLASKNQKSKSKIAMANATDDEDEQSKEMAPLAESTRVEMQEETD